MNGQMVNWYEIMPKKFLNTSHNPNIDYHGIKIPSRHLIVGGSGTGKTTVLLSMVKAFSDKTKNKKGVGTFKNVWVFCKSDDEPIYRYMKSLSPQIHIYEGLSQLDLKKFDNKYEQNLVVFDDLVLEKNQKAIEQLYIRGRKLGGGVTTVYLTQSFFLTPKVIRNNCSYMWILKLAGQREVSIIMREFALGVDKDTLLSIYDYATRQKLMPLMVDLEAPASQRFRRGIFEPISIQDFIRNAYSGKIVE